MQIRCLLLLLLSGLASASGCPKWSQQEAYTTITTLAVEVYNHDILYHEKHAPQISDTEYDALIARLKQLHTCYPNIPIKKFNHTPEEQSLKHQAFMGSLKKADSDKDIKHFLHQINSTPLLLQPKIDGIAVELVYEKGSLVKAITRGNGHQGQNILRSVRHMNLVPQRLLVHKTMTLHGELFARLDRVDKTLLKQYVSARHFVAGQVNRKQPEQSALQAIDFFPWRWIDSPYSSETQTIAALKKLGFTHPSLFTHSVNSLEDIKHWQDHYRNSKHAVFLMDGIVIKADDFDVRKQLGWNREHPKWALAWKFAAHYAVTTVKDIIFTTGSTGRVTPVLILNPVKIDGKTISRVSLGSMKNLKSKGVVIGNEISILLKGNAIPVFGRVISKSNKIEK